MLNADLILRLRTACSPESPLGKLCSEAADTLEGVSEDYLRRHNDAVDRFEIIQKLKGHLAEAEEILKPFADKMDEIEPGMDSNAMATMTRFGS